MEHHPRCTVIQSRAATYLLTKLRWSHDESRDRVSITLILLQTEGPGRGAVPDGGGPADAAAGGGGPGQAAHRGGGRGGHPLRGGAGIRGQASGGIKSWEHGTQHRFVDVYIDDVQARAARVRGVHREVGGHPPGGGQVQ